jgi:hypothetical protein
MIGYDDWKTREPETEGRDASISPCCQETIEESGTCAGCGERVAPCTACGGEGEIEVLHGSQAGLDSPRTKVIACPTCQGEPDEPDYDEDDADEFYDGSLDPDWEVRL